VEHELAALGLGHRCCDADLAAELIRPVCLALADALGLGGVPGIKLPAALALLLAADLPGSAERDGEDRLERLVSLGLAPDIADHAAQTNAQELELAIVTLELLGVSVASGHDRGPLGNPHIGLPERYAMLPGVPPEHHDRLVRQV